MQGSGVPFFHDLNDGYLVLSIDDDPINQMVVENLLSTEGYNIEQALGKGGNLHPSKMT